jgi:hypothetical protein
LSVRREGAREVTRTLDFYNLDAIFAEDQAMRRIPMHMADWITKLNAFLTLNERAILDLREKSRMTWPWNAPRANTSNLTDSASGSLTAGAATSTLP